MVSPPPSPVLPQTLQALENDPVPESEHSHLGVDGCLGQQAGCLGVCLHRDVSGCGEEARVSVPSNPVSPTGGGAGSWARSHRLTWAGSSSLLASVSPSLTWGSGLTVSTLDGPGIGGQVHCPSRPIHSPHSHTRPSHTAMVELDGDDVRISSRGKLAERDIVQVKPSPCLPLSHSLLGLFWKGPWREAPGA